jgi:hypothetical protein
LPKSICFPCHVCGGCGLLPLPKSDRLASMCHFCRAGAHILPRSLPSSFSHHTLSLHIYKTTAKMAHMCVSGHQRTPSRTTANNAPWSLRRVVFKVQLDALLCPLPATSPNVLRLARDCETRVSMSSRLAVRFVPKLTRVKTWRCCCVCRRHSFRCREYWEPVSYCTSTRREAQDISITQKARPCPAVTGLRNAKPHTQ